VQRDKPGGWIAERTFQIGVGSVISATAVYEPPGFKGELLTPWPQNERTVAVRMRFHRRDRTVYASQKVALVAFEAHERARKKRCKAGLSATDGAFCGTAARGA
jgi:hypothetical protein